MSGGEGGGDLWERGCGGGRDGRERGRGRLCGGVKGGGIWGKEGGVGKGRMGSNMVNGWRRDILGDDVAVAWDLGCCGHDFGADAVVGWEGWCTLGGVDFDTGMGAGGWWGGICRAWQECAPPIYLRDGCWEGMTALKAGSSDSNAVWIVGSFQEELSRWRCDMCWWSGQLMDIATVLHVES